MVSSVYSGRLFKQLENMRKYKNRYLIIIGKPYKMDSKKEKLFSTVQVSAQEEYGCKVVYVESLQMYVYECIKIADKIFKINKKVEEGEDIVPHIVKRVRHNDDLIRILMSFPNISSVRAKNLLRKFGTLNNVFCASYEELLDVDMIGNGIAIKILKVLSKFYEGNG